MASAKFSNLAWFKIKEACAYLLTNRDQRPEARQLLSSLLQYMQSTEFHPERQVGIEKIQGLFASEKEGKLLSAK